MVDFPQTKILDLKKLWADIGYHGKNLKAKLMEKGIDLEIVKSPINIFEFHRNSKILQHRLKKKVLKL